jgi:hypothetical protein
MKVNFKIEVFVFKILLSIMIFLLRSYLVLIVWNWRLVEFIPQANLPQISFNQACSLQVSIVLMVVGTLKLQAKDKDETKGEYYSYYESTIVTGFFIGLVWLFSCF